MKRSEFLRMIPGVALLGLLPRDEMVPVPQTTGKSMVVTKSENPYYTDPDAWCFVTTSPDCYYTVSYEMMV